MVSEQRTPLSKDLPPQDDPVLDNPRARQKLARRMSLDTHPTKGVRYYLRNERKFTPDVETIIRNSALEQGINPEFLRTVMLAESGGWSEITSPAGAVGPAQWMPGSWKDWSKKYYGESLPAKDRQDPAKSIPVAASFLSWIQRYLSEPKFRTKKSHRAIEAVPVNSWNRSDWSKIWGAYNTGIYGFVGRRRWQDPSYMEGMLEKRLVNAQKALQPQTRILLFGDSITDGFAKSNDIGQDMRQKGWDVLILPKKGSDSKFWMQTFKSPGTDEQVELNKKITEFGPTHIVVGSLGGNDSKYLIRSRKTDNPAAWESYKTRYVKPLMGVVSQWGGPPPAGSEFMRYDLPYDELKKQINDEYKKMASDSNTFYHDSRVAATDAGMKIEPQTWHFTSDQYRSLWKERSRAIDNMIKGQPLTGPPAIELAEPAIKPRELGEKLGAPFPVGSKDSSVTPPTQEELDKILKSIQQKSKFFQLERKNALQRMQKLLSENA